jgi:hypothetical protein
MKITAKNNARNLPVYIVDMLRINANCQAMAVADYRRAEKTGDRYSSAYSCGVKQAYRLANQTILFSHRLSVARSS